MTPPDRWREAAREISDEHLSPCECQPCTSIRESVIAEILRRLFPAREEGWRSIETAPRDGTEILVDFGRCGIRSVAWAESTSGSEIWCVDDRKFGPYALRGYIETDVKGWRPLPASTESERQKEERDD